jgi:beta-phosphoglucomutase
MGKGVIWDLDGVLADTAEAHFRCWVTALAEKEIPLDRPTFDGLFGMNNRDILAQLLGRPHRRYFSVELEGAGWIQGITPSTPKANVELVLGILGIRQRFEVILSDEEQSASKPDPTLFLRAAEALGLPPERCVVVEDAPAGVEAACKAGMPCVAVATTRPREALAAVTTSALLFDDLTQITKGDFSNLIKSN